MEVENKENVCTKSPISINSPVILGFVGISAIALLLGYVTSDKPCAYLFCVYRGSPLNPLTYIRLIGHVFGHANLQHFLGNIILLLVIGPLLEEKYGSINMLIVIGITAVVTGIGHIIFFENALLGASGVVFAFMLLSSVTGFKGNKIPLTFIFVALFYSIEQIHDALFVKDNVSNFGHIVGGIVGSIFGFVINKYWLKKGLPDNQDDPYYNFNYFQ